METLGDIILWFLLLIFVLDFVLIFIWAITLLKNKTPFIPTPRNVFSYIEKAFGPLDNAKFFDLGSGDARVINYLAQKNLSGEFVGIENNLFAIILTKIKFFFKKIDNTKILKQNFFDTDISSATHIYLYIYPNVMDDLLPKFDKELKSGTKIVSLNYSFTNKKPIASIDLKKKRFRIARKLFIYEF